MPTRLRLFDFRMSRGPQMLGLCRDDVVAVANAVNAAQERLLYADESGDEGWYGTWAEILMLASRTTPYVTLPREIARLQFVDVCNRPVALNNQFFEYVRFGNGRLPKFCRNGFNCMTQAFERNNAIVFIEPPTVPFYLQVFALDPADVAAANRVLFSGIDSNKNLVLSQDDNNEISGEYVTCENPFGQSVNAFDKLTGIQKDVTVGQIQVMAVDATTGVQTLILTMEPSEQVASYRRYYFHSLPCTCPASQGCTTPQAIPIRAIAKLDLIPATVDQDYLLLQSLEALIEESQSARFAAIDGLESKTEAIAHHKAAIKYLNGQLTHYLGKNNPAIEFAPFGSARLERAKIGTMI